MYTACGFNNLRWTPIFVDFGFELIHEIKISLDILITYFIDRIIGHEFTTYPWIFDKSTKTDVHEY